MSKFSWLSASIGKKVLTAFTGLFLCLFLVGHLVGNLQLFMTGPEALLQFNEYAKFMTTNPAVKAMSYITYFCIIFHAVMGIYLAFKNKSARKVGYARDNTKLKSVWASRHMGILGTAVLGFIILHMSAFWRAMKFTELALDSAGNKDIYSEVVTAFSKEWYVGLYVLAMIPIGFHLSHGFQSGFQSLGLNHPKYTPITKTIGFIFSIVVPALFAAIPVYVYFVIN